MSTQKNVQNYTQYLKTPEQKEAFLAGCQALADVIKSSSAENVTYIVGNLNEDRLLSMILKQQSYNADLQSHNAYTIIKHGSLKKSDIAAMALGFAINDAGYAIDETGYVVEDGAFQLKPGMARRPWPYTLARNKQTGAQITRDEYDNLAPEQQENYDVLRYLDIWDEADNEVLLKCVTQDNKVFMAELLRWSADDDQYILRYLCECGAGRDELSRGLLYEYRRDITDIAKEMGVISEMMATQISQGYINSVGQYYLAWLQSLCVALKPIHLTTMNAYQLATLKLLMTATTDNMAYDISDADIRLYRNVNGDGMQGAIVSEEDTQGILTWRRIPASDDRCDICTQKNYICEVLIPRVGDIIVQAFTHLSKDALAEMKPDALTELFALVDTIDPEFFDDDEDDCTGCAGCDGDPNAIKGKNPDAEDGEEPEPKTDGEPPEQE